MLAGFEPHLGLGDDSDLNQGSRITNRLFVGDSRLVLQKVPSDLVDLIHTSPPYNIEKPYADGEDNLDQDDYIGLLSDIFSQCYRVLKPNGSFFLQTGYSQDASDQILPIDMLTYQNVLDLGFKLWDRIIWSYRGGVSFSRKFKNTHETILWWVKPKPDGSLQPYFDVDAVRERSVSYDKRNNLFGKNPGNVWEEDRVAFGGQSRATSHIAIYPESVTERIIRSCSQKGDLVLDPFAGSGTTPAVARSLGRDFLGVELSPTYAAEASTRIGRKQASEEATLASGLLKYVGFKNTPCMLSKALVMESLGHWLDGFDLEMYCNIKQDMLQNSLARGDSTSTFQKDRKPLIWGYFDDLYAKAENDNDKLILVSCILDYCYPLRKNWNSLRKFCHALEAITTVIEMSRNRLDELVDNIVACEPSSFKVDTSGVNISFEGPPIRVRISTSKSSSQPYVQGDASSNSLESDELNLGEGFQ